jgi:predicted MPP superfamily phosphohydrolase
VGPTILKDYVDNVVKKTLALTPDMIAVTGDLIDGTPEILKNHVAPLGLLKAPHGVFYVTGNHEYYWNVDSWLSKVQELGFQSLLNENKILTIGKSKIMIAGVTDTSAENFKTEHKSNPAKAFISSEKCDYKILLAHRPDSCIEAAKAGFDLQLSGHTHAGQFFPFNLIVSFVHRYYKGLNRHENMWVYVNSGTGYWGPANRFAVPSEITLVTLKKAT